MIASVLSHSFCYFCKRVYVWTTAQLVRNRGPWMRNDWGYEKQLLLQLSVSFVKTHSVQLGGKNIDWRMMWQMISYLLCHT